MVRFFLPVLWFVLAVHGAFALDLGKTDRLWREYLSETVRRGLPLLSDAPDSGGVPYWPTLDRFRAEAQILEPSDDVTLLGAWIDRAEKSGDPGVLKDRWPRPRLDRFSVRQWGEALFAAWDPGAAPQEWTDAWLAWADKVYSAPALVRGLAVLERSDPSAVVPLATQALELYPEDRRLLPFVLRYPQLSQNPAALLSRDRAPTGGWAPSTLKTLVDRSPGTRDLLIEAGYTPAVLDAALANDYGPWLTSTPGKNPPPGAWTWDSDNDGMAETSLVFDETGLTSWSRKTSAGFWTLGFQEGKPESLRETRSGSSWTLLWEAYPWASRLEYRWGDHTLVYRYRPLVQSVPLWPQERFQAASDRWPATLAALWLPLDPKALVASAATIETWVAGKKTDTVFLYRGEVWLEVQDADSDGVDDTWSYFRSGRLASVYHSVDGRGQAGLRELYLKGELNQVQAKASALRNEFVLFPLQGVQLWDPHGDGRPLERVFLWSGNTLGALVFTKDALPWETMPGWEPRP